MDLWRDGRHQRRRRRAPGDDGQFLTSISLDPPLILVCLHKQAPTCQLIQQTGVFAVSLLGAQHEAISAQFAGYTQLPEGADRFYNVETRTSGTGAPILADAIGWMDCRVFGTHDGATHLIIVGQVLETGRMDDPVQPLVYHNRAYRSFTVTDPQTPS